MDELERRVKELGVNGVVRHRKLGRKLNSFNSSLKEMK